MAWNHLLHDFLCFIWPDKQMCKSKWIRQQKSVPFDVKKCVMIYWLLGKQYWLSFFWCLSNGPRQANLVLIAYASSEGSGEPAHPRSLARTFAARSYKQWVKRNLQTESQIPGPSEWLGMRSWNLSWRNAQRHKFAWRGSNDESITQLIMPALQC